jgi:hypothetical protein
MTSPRDPASPRGTWRLGPDRVAAPSPPPPSLIEQLRATLAFRLALTAVFVGAIWGAVVTASPVLTATLIAAYLATCAPVVVTFGRATLPRATLLRRRW